MENLALHTTANNMSSKAYKVSNLNESTPQRGGTGNIITTVSCLITYINCCMSFLIAYNATTKQCY